MREFLGQKAALLVFFVLVDLGSPRGEVEVTEFSSPDEIAAAAEGKKVKMGKT